MAVAREWAAPLDDPRCAHLQGLIAALEARDADTCGHSDRVAQMATCLATRLGLATAARQEIYLAGLLHDVGKIGIPDRVLHKAGRLDPDERKLIEQHPEIGYRMLSSIDGLESILPGVRHHHEAWDGSGYPHRLQGKRIPRMARIIAVADSLDALVSNRPYRNGLDADTADGILRDGAGRQWDPAMIEAYTATRAEMLAICEIGHDARQCLAVY